MKTVGGIFMKLKNMPIEEIELLSYTDLTYLLLKENNKSMNTPTIFKEICNLLGFSDDEYTAKIGDYYTSLTIDKRFVLLDNNEWDIRDRHSVELVMDDEEDSEEEVEETEEEEEIDDEVMEEDDIDEVIDDEIDDDDIDELSIVSEDEVEEE